MIDPKTFEWSDTSDNPDNNGYGNSWPDPREEQEEEINEENDNDED